MRPNGESQIEMKSGACLGAPLALLAVGALVLLPTKPIYGQNLGLGTGSRSQSQVEDSTLRERGDLEDAPAAARKMHKRLGLSARRNSAFDPKLFEARGRELQGQFYEIGTSANPRHASSSPMDAGSEAVLQRKGRNQWMLWVGVAGLAGASAGVVGFVLMSKAHPAAPPPEDLVITDEN